MNYRWPRNLELLRWTPTDKWTLDRATTGLLILGSPGSGKTSGPFNTVVRSFLRAGFGGIFLVAKADATAQYIQLVSSENRQKDLIVFGPDTSDYRFGVLQYEVSKSGAKTIVENIVLLLMQAVEISSRRQGHHGDQFFEDAMKALLRHCLFVVITATGKADLGLVLEIVQSLPASLNQLEEPERLRSMQLLAEAERRATPERRHELELARKYFLHEWPTLADRTRSSIAITLSVLLDAFLRYPLRDMFLGELTVSPDDVLAGKIVIVDVSVKTFDLIGKIAGVLWKYSVQRAIERRPELTSGQPVETIRPIFIACDECQFFSLPLADSYFQMSARSARGITLYATQSLSNLFSELGGDGTARARVDSLLGNIATRIGCQNLDHATNHWFAESLGQVVVRRQSRSVTTKNFVETFLAENGAISKPANVSISEQADWDVSPRIFAGLKRPDQGIVEAILVCAGERFKANRKRWLRVRFDQFKEPKGLRRFISRNVLITVPRLKG